MIRLKTALACLILLCLFFPFLNPQPTKAQVLYVKVEGYVEKGGQVIQTSPTVSYKTQESFPGATVTVYLKGTVTLATIYTTESGTLKSNPFTADSSGLYSFFAASGKYDVKFSGVGISVPFTTSVVIFNSQATGWIDVISVGGAKGDAVLATDGTSTGGSNLFTSGSHACVVADANKSIIVYGAGSLSATSGLNNALRTTITGCSGSNFVLTTTATASTTSTRFVYGTDDTAAFQTAINSLTSGGVLFIPPKLYMVGSVTLLDGIEINMPPTAIIYSISTSVFLFNDKNNITIDGVNIDAGGNTSSGGSVTLIGGNRITNTRIRNCTLIDTFLTGGLAPVNTFNRHGILVRDYSHVWIFNNKIETCLRIKAAGGSIREQYGYVFHNVIKNTNENGISLLNGNNIIVSDIYVCYNIIDGITATGGAIVTGSDGGTDATQQYVNINIIGNTAKGRLPSNTSFLTDRGSGVERDIRFNYNSFDNSTGSGESTVIAINKANQGSATSQTVNFEAIGNHAYGYFNFAAFRFGNIADGNITLNQVKTSSSGSIDRGFNIGSCDNLNIQNNKTIGATFGMDFTDVTNSVVDNNFILSSGTAGIVVETSGVSKSSSLTVKNNHIWNSGSYGVDYGFSLPGTYTDKYVDNDIVGSGSKDFHNQPVNTFVLESPNGSIKTLTNNSATPVVVGERFAKVSNSSATLLTDLAEFSPNTNLTLLCTNGNSTFQNNANLVLTSGTDTNCPINTTISFYYDGTKKYQVK